MISSVLHRKDFSLNLTPTFSLQPAQACKITAVALASLALFSVQLGFSLSTTIGLSLACTSITLLSEKLKTNSSDWFSVKDINKEMLFFDLGLRLIFVPLYTGLVYTLLGPPSQVVALRILACDIRVIALATLIAPITEEILFRGFIQERSEDVCKFINRHVLQIKKETQPITSWLLQGIFFGACHITGNQILGNLAHKAIVFISLATNAIYLSSIKDRDKSLISPILLHSAQNIGMVLGLRAFRPFIVR